MMKIVDERGREGEEDRERRCERKRERESEIVEEGGKERSEMHSNVFERGE